MFLMVVGYDLREDWNWAKLELARGVITQIGLVLNNLHEKYISDDRIRIITEADSIC